MEAALLQTIQLKILGQMFGLASGANINAKKLTLCWVAMVQRDMEAIYTINRSALPDKGH